MARSAGQILEAVQNETMRFRLAALLAVLGSSYALIACASHPGMESRPLERQAGQPPASTSKGTRGEGVPAFWIRPGYRVELVADVPNARFLETDDKGNLYVTRPDAGDIWTLRLKNGKWQKVGTFTSGRATVHGMHFVDGWLWFTTSGGVFKGRDTNGDGVADEIQDICPEGSLPHGGHWWRSIFVVKDGFFTSIGDASNISDLRSSDREKIWFYSLDGKTKRLWSSGIRNTEKLRYRPGTTELYGWDQGSDNYGKGFGEQTGRMQPITDQIPPEEFNLYVEGGFYGHPFIMGNGVPRQEWLNKPGVDIIQLANDNRMPARASGPHWAADGWCWLTRPGLGADLKGDCLVAFHGSWNRVHKAGYRIERVLIDKVTGQPIGEQMLVGCLTDDERVLARPVDCTELPDGSILWSDDQFGKIYRLSLAK